MSSNIDNQEEILMDFSYVKGGDGAPGLPGAKGAKGSKGYNGSQGHSGLPGLPGEQGAPGFPGMKGSDGLPGPNGQKGDLGPRGCKGFKGEKGQTGSKETRNSVYFSVSLKSDLQLFNDSIILKFDGILRNEGRGYNPKTGVFTASNNGVYLFLFSVEVGKDRGDIAHVALYVAGAYWAYVMQESAYDGHDAMASNSFVSYMSAGDKTWIQSANTSSQRNHLAQSGTTFGGILLY